MAESSAPSSSSSSSKETPSSPCGYLISHDASLTQEPSDPNDIYRVPEGTEFVLQHDVDHTDPFKDNTTLLVCVTCLFPLTESDRNIIDRVKIGLALDQEFIPNKVYTVFVSLTYPPKEPQSAGMCTKKTIELNVGLPRFSQVTSQEVIDYLTKYFGPTYKIVRDINGILTSISPVTLKLIDDEVSYYSVPAATKFHFYPGNNADGDHKYHLLLELNSEQTILTYNSSKDVYSVPKLIMSGESNSFKLKDITSQPVGGNLSVILTYFFRQRNPPDFRPILVQQLQAYHFSNITVYSIVNRQVSTFGATNIITASVATSSPMSPEDFATLSREVQSVVLRQFAGRSVTVLPVSGPGLLN